MIRYRTPLLAGIAALLLCAGVPLAQNGLTTRVAQAAPPSTLTPRGDPRFGVVEAWRAPAQASAIGVGWERISFWWKELQPDGPDSWNEFATGRDHFITKELAAGRQLAGLLINTPDWAAANPGVHGASVPRGLYLPYDDPHNYWGHFVGLIAKRYAGRIDDWVIWNEVNIPSGQWHTWDGTVADYAQLIKVASLAAKAANPQARIVLFGDPYWYDHGAFFTTLLKDLTSSSGARAHHAYFDVANLHLYSRPADLAPLITLYRAKLAGYGLHQPIWISETNAIPYNDPVRLYPKAGFFATLDDQASYIVQAFAIDLALGVARIEVNRMVDGTDFIAGGEPFGLLRNDGSARPAYDAFRTVTTLFAGVTGGTLAVNQVSGVYIVTLHKPHATVTVVWDQSPLGATVRILAPRTGGTVFDKLGHGQVVRPSGGYYTFNLDRATGNTNANDAHDYVIGGSPVILVQRV
jgi:hypothetical protein